MPRAEVPTGVTLEYESRGADHDPTVLLIAGFGAQLITWDDGFCQGLADGGRRVVRFDNRDCGRSTLLDGPALDLAAVIAAASEGDLDRARSLVPYTLAEMADDAVGLLDHLGVDAAHIVGSSMGGMIAQLVAIRHPGRVRTLTSMMSSTGEPDVGQSTPEAAAALLGPPATDRGDYIDDRIRRTRIWSSRRHFDEAAGRELAGACFDRGLSPEGTLRQLGALLATGSLADGLRLLAVPTLVIHGTDDTLITPSGGERTAALVPGAELLIVPDMGHDRPEPLWPVLWDAILGHTAA